MTKVRLSGEQVRRLDALRIKYPQLRGINQALGAAIDFATRDLPIAQQLADEREVKEQKWERLKAIADRRGGKSRRRGSRREPPRPMQVERPPAPTLEELAAGEYEPRPPAPPESPHGGREGASSSRSSGRGGSSRSSRTSSGREGASSSSETKRTIGGVTPPDGEGNHPTPPEGTPTTSEGGEKR